MWQPESLFYPRRDSRCHVAATWIEDNEDQQGRTPANAIQAIVVQMRPDLVGISVTMPPLLQGGVADSSVAPRHPGLRILLGGRGVRGETGLAEELAVELRPLHSPSAIEHRPAEQGLGGQRG
jgi:hypothetical protein